MRRRMSKVLRSAPPLPQETPASLGESVASLPFQTEEEEDDSVIIWDDQEKRAMAFDEVSSPVLAYKFSGLEFDPDKCECHNCLFAFYSSLFSCKSQRWELAG